MPAEPLPRLRTFTVVSSAGARVERAVSGHELDTSDPNTFRVFRSEHGQRLCVGAFDRQQVIGVFEAADTPVTNGRPSEDVPAVETA